MADDSDVPPLEDMTEVLKQVDAIRERRETAPEKVNKSQREKAKERAKVNKKNVTARAVAPEKLAGGDSVPTKSTEEAQNLKSGASPSPSPSPSTLTKVPAQSKPATVETAKKSQNEKSNLFGGLKKGFLFGGSAPSKPKQSTSVQKTETQNAKPVNVNAKPDSSAPPVKEMNGSKVKKDDEVPFIKPSGKTESGLTFDEVQQAMTETKGLMENQDWITDDLLNKVEGNELLLKRFGDPHFMKALEEFQANPQAAMEKYKSNKEVEKFLLEFCGLLGDHFTHMGNSGANPPGSQSSKKSSQPATASTQNVTSKTSSPVTPAFAQHSTTKPQGPKIVEITDDSVLTNKKSDGPKIVELSDESSVTTKTKPSNQQPKIVEITDNSSSTTPPSRSKDAIKVSGKTADSKRPTPDILTRSPAQGADMAEMPQASDEEVKQMLSDPKVMEILMDPQIMNLIQLLRANPTQAQKTIDTASGDLRDKVRFLVSKGLLQFQTG